MTLTTSDPMRPPLALTPGEPGGIGPDLTIQLAATDWRQRIVVIAAPELLEQRARQLGVPLEILAPDAESVPAGTLRVNPVPLGIPARAAELQPANARYVLTCLDRAVDGCLDGRFHGMVTGPVHKAVINEAGIPFSGHTEYLAQRSGGALPVMMLACPGLRVALVTTHLPLRDVAAQITADRLEKVLRILLSDLRDRFAIASPQVRVLGLNPHAGEGGHLGTEEQTIIDPLLERLRGEGYRLSGPVSADTAFAPERLAGVDAVLAMYHDQGLIPLKMRGFGRAVNITLGLPLIRTSVDHGTALDLAGTGRADPASLIAALEAADAMRVSP